MIPPAHSITIRPPLAVVGHPAKSWHRTITITQNEHAVMTFHPVLESRAANGQLMPVHLPWIRVPAEVRVKGGTWRPVTVSSVGHGILGLEKLYLAFEPLESKGAAGVSVSASPAARLIVGKYPGINHSTMQVSTPWIVWGTHATITTHIRDSGKTWFVPTLGVQGGGQTRSTALPPLLPGMHEVSTSAVTLPTWGISTVKVRTTGSPPITRQIVSLPGLPLAIALGAGGLVEVLNLAVKPKKSKNPKETKS